ncbi:hypothetical protein LGK37_06735 [Clostridioides difficile]|nr:hypothetical protein [Clostridioides difficile]
MYKYMNDVEIIINNMLDVFGINVKKSATFYKSRINNFFEIYMGTDGNEYKSLDALTYYDVEIYLGKLRCSDAEKLNVYNALKRFFEYTYLEGKTKEIISQVKRPTCIKKPNEVLNEEEYLKLKSFIVSRNENLNVRLILGLFLFTGLSRKYIANLRNNDFKFDEGVYKLIIWKGDEEIQLPLKSELQLIINEYCNNLSDEEKFDKLVKISENAISDYISKLIDSIIGRRCTPTILSNTFISKALSSGNYIYEVSNLTLETVHTIAKHVKNDKDLINRQTSILNSF